MKKRSGMVRMDHAIRRMEDWSGRASAFLIFVIMILVTVDVLSRGIWRKSLVFADEYAGYLFVGVVFLGLAHTSRSGAHIGVDLIVGRLQGVRKAVIELLANMLVLTYVTLLVWFSIRFLLNTIAVGMRSSTVMHTPMFIPQLLVPVGLCIFGLHLLASLIRNISALLAWGKESRA
ncbi:MAG: TRAP transporter small permease [Chloroflexi bacterium]|nr:TRAP transporter small permease [Chloroflexota bacterium]